MALTDHWPTPDEGEARPGVRRHSDRCFQAVEKLVKNPDGTREGYIVEGFLIPVDEIAEVCRLNETNEAPRSCRSIETPLK